MKGERSSSNLTVLGETLAGAVAGGLTRSVLSPLDFLKIRLQLVNAGTSEPALGASAYARSVLYREGVLAFWRGSGTGVALWAAYMAVQFPLYHSARRALEAPLAGVQWGLPSALIAGGAAGVGATMLTYPLDWARTRLAAASAAPVGSGGVVPWATPARGGLQRLFSSTPPTQWYGGLLPSVFSILPAMALTFYFYEALGQSFDALLPSPPPHLGALRSLVCGGLGGGLAKLLTYPLDTVKKRMQVMPHQYPGAWRALEGIALGPEGFRGLFKGLSPALLKAVASSALGFATYDATAQVLFLVGHPLAKE
jgi:hypothetical protein